MTSTTFVPVLRIAARPNLMSRPTAANVATDSLTSGGSTLMPVRRHSFSYSADLSFVNDGSERLVTMSAGPSFIAIGLSTTALACHITEWLPGGSGYPAQLLGGGDRDAAVAGADKALAP
jgi:hypothetical protein